VALVLDTGVLYAALDENDADHDRCGGLLGSTPEQLVIPAPVFVELDSWMRKFGSADGWLTFCEDVATGAYTIYPLDAELLVAAARLQTRYSDLPLGMVDAAVFATCEAIGERKVATLDHRDFGILRTNDGKALDIVP
jgi:predicted nucleic acid-binding protein